MPLAFLIHTDLAATLSILENILLPAPHSSDPVTALEVLLRSWCENSETFQGSWAIRISSLAMSALFSASASRETLRNIRVRGDMIVDESTKNGA